MNTLIKFRGKTIGGDWVYGNLSVLNKRLGPIDPGCYISNEAGSPFAYQVRPETVGQFTGIQDKTGQRIYGGDLILIRTPYRSTQTHTGDNIPRGSYVEPLTPEIRSEIFEVKFADGMFYVDPGENHLDIDNLGIPVKWIIQQYGLESLKQAVNFYKSDDFFADPEEGDLTYLLESYPPSRLEELLEWISGCKIVGNATDDPNYEQ